LHGLALDVGGERIQGVTNQGTVRPGAAKPVPLAVPHAPKGECVLVVATLPEGSTGKLSLSFGDDVADLRGKSYAHIEVCGASDAPDEKVELISSVEEPVQWAAYRTDGLETKKKAKRVASEPPAPSAERPTGVVRIAPIEALGVYVRPGATTWLVGSVGDASMGDVFTSGAALGVGAGVRVGSGWFAYGEWERSFLGVGTKSPIFNFREVSSHGDAFLVGGRKTFMGWAVRPGGKALQISPLIDVGLGYAVLRQDGTDVAGDSRTLRLPTATARLMFGASLRPFRWLSVDPVIGSGLGWVNQIEAEQTVGGATRSTTNQFESGSVRVSFFGGVGVSADLPFGDASPPAAAASRTTARAR
jgi:hypothetical protein